MVLIVDKKNMENFARAVEIVGGQSRLASILGVTASAVNHVSTGLRPLPAKWCPIIEAATEHKVKCEDLRPDVRWEVLRRKHD